MKGGNLVIYQREIPIFVEPIPYLEIIKPILGTQFPLHKNVDIEAKLVKSSIILDPQIEFADNPNSLIWVQILDEKGKPFKSFSLNQADQKGLFKGVILRSDIKKEGKYSLLFQLSGKLKTGTIFKAIPEEISFLKKMDFLDYIIYHWLLILIFLIIGVIVFDWQRIGRENKWWYWRFGMPRLSGIIYIKSTDSEKDKDIVLKGRKKRLTKQGKANFFQKADLGVLYAKKEKDEEGLWRNIVYFRPADDWHNEIKLYDNFERKFGDLTIRYESY
jgi:hypothetical protein